MTSRLDHEFKPHHKSGMFCSVCGHDSLAHGALGEVPPDPDAMYKARLRSDLKWAFSHPAASVDHFTVRLFRVIAHADTQNRERLRLGFPDEVYIYEDYING